MTKVSDWLILKNQVFHWSRHCHQYLNPYMISPYESFTTNTLYTYIHVTNLTFLWNYLQAYNIGDSLQWRRNTKTKHVPIFCELCHNSTRFAPFLPKSSPQAIHRV